MKLKIIQRILDAIKNSHSFCVVGHIRPDGDCIGSQLGITLALKNLGKNVVCWNEDPVPDKLAFLDPNRIVTTAKPNLEFDCVIATDAASYERLGCVGEFVKKRKLLINIDHHQSNTRYGDLNWVAQHHPSTGELIYRILHSAKWTITPEIANCLFTAVSTDTGSFQYPTTRPDTYYVAGKLVERGANLALICDQVYQSYPISRVRLLRHVYNNFRLVHNNQIAYFWIKSSDYSRFGADRDESEGLIDHIRDIENVVAACMFEELEPGVTRISLRSKNNRINVNEIAKQFAGGGHPAAAGARLLGNHLTVQRKVIGALKKALSSPAS